MAASISNVQEVMSMGPQPVHLGAHPERSSGDDNSPYPSGSLGGFRGAVAQPTRYERGLRRCDGRARVAVAQLQRRKDAPTGADYEEVGQDRETLFLDERGCWRVNAMGR